MKKKVKPILDKDKKQIKKIKPGTRKKTKKISKERSIIRRQISFIKNLPKIIKEDTEEKKETKDDSLDNMLLSEDSSEEKEENIPDNSYGRKGAGGSSIYTGSADSPYTNYDDIWSFLGQFKTKGAYNISEYDKERLENTPLVIPSTPQILCDFQVIETCIKHQKYFTPGDNMNGTYGSVPMGGINSKDWQKFQLWAQVDYVMYKLFMDTM